MFMETGTAITCSRCGRVGDPPPAQRVAFPGAVKQRVLGGICASCWKEWEGMEVKVINEYRLNLWEPQHREQIQRACLEFLGLSPLA